MADTGLPLPRPAGRRPELLFLSISRVPNTILDSTLRRFLFTRASDVVVLNGELADYGELVRAIKLEFPSIKVLRYANAQRIPASTRVASTMYCHFLEHAYTQVLQLLSGVPKVDGDGTIFTDITTPDTRDFIVSHLVEQVAAHGVDGVLVDSFHTDLVDADTYVDGALKSRQWPGACRQLLHALGAALPGKLIWFNGLWAWLLEAQSALLASADGATVEFYGYDGRPKGTSNSFETFVERINTVLTAHPNKPILVRGTPAGNDGNDYYDYLTDLRQARYCYGCYLLARTPRSAFSYAQSFQLTRLPKHRTGGAAMFSYFELPLGSPAGPAVQPNGTEGWSRPYAGGVVFVAPADGGTKTWQLTSVWWTTLGNRVSAGTSVVLDPGDAAILLRRRPQPPPAELEVDLEGSANDSLVDGATGEWLVQGLTGEYHYLQMILTVRSEDPMSAVLVRFETNDNDNVNPRRPFGILTILPDGEGTPFDPGNKDYPYGQNTTLGAMHVTSSLRYPLIRTPRDGASEISINLAEECSPLPCFRVISVRAIGSVNVEGIRLGKLSPISGL